MKKLFTVLLSFVCIFLLSACNSGGSGADAGSQQKAPEPVVNKAAQEVTIQAEVNGKYFTESTRHGVVYAQGSNGEKSILRGLSDEKSFHAALLEIGATPGENVKMDHMNAKNSQEGVSVEGSKLNVFVTWEGSNGEIPFADIVKATDPRPMDIRFGGNLAAATEKNTGCILCLDTCAVGITSDAAYPTGTSQNKEVDFYGDANVLPKDGTKVSVIFRLAE